MMGERQVDQAALFYEFSLEQHVPADHLLRLIDRFVDLSDVRQHLAPFYSATGRLSVDPELLVRMLIIGYCHGIRSERRLCEEVHLNLAYRWFCRLGLEGEVPDHSTFSKNRHGRFRKSDLLRHVFETVVGRCMAEGLPPELSSRAVDEYLAVLDDAAFGAASEVTPKFLSPADPAARWTAAQGGQAFFAYCTNYLIDLDHAVILDVEGSTAVRQAEVTAAKTMIERTQERFDLTPKRLAADTAYGSAEMLGWLVDERGIAPHVPVFDNSKRRDGTFSREDFTFDAERDHYVCPGGKVLQQYRRDFKTPRSGITKAGMRLYRASQSDCQTCAFKERCRPKAPARKVPRSLHEGARDLARKIAKTEAYATSRRERKKVEMLFAHLKRILRLGRLRLRGPCGAHDEFLLAATAQNLRKLAKLIPMQQPAATA